MQKGIYHQFTPHYTESRTPSLAASKNKHPSLGTLSRKIQR